MQGSIYETKLWMGFFFFQEVIKYNQDSLWDQDHSFSSIPTQEITKSRDSTLSNCFKQHFLLFQVSVPGKNVPYVFPYFLLLSAKNCQRCLYLLIPILHTTHHFHMNLKSLFSVCLTAVLKQPMVKQVPSPSAEYPPPHCRIL